MQFCAHSVWIHGSPKRELEEEGEKSNRRKQKGKVGNISRELGSFASGQVMIVQGAASQNIGGQREKGGGKGKQKGKQLCQQQDQRPPKCFVYGEGHQVKDCSPWK